MRIIAGIAKGMVLATPQTAGTRPTSDRVREAIFSSLGERVVGVDALDLYAGTGALGLEAASRGARAVVFVDRQVDVIQKNVTAFRRYADVEFQVRRGEVIAQLRKLDRQFPLIFADPPYAMDPAPLLEVVRDRLEPGGMLVLETSKRAKLNAGLLWELQREAVYGETRVCHLVAASLGGN